MTKERRALGTGLDALIRDTDSSKSASTDNVQIVPLSKIEARREQPREYFDDDAIHSLADSIKQYGLIQPIVVRLLDTGYYQIIAGERRWRASKLAELKEVPIRVIDADDRLTAELALVENLQREDLNPIEESKGYKKLMEDYDLTQDEVSKVVGKSRPAIANSLRLLSLCDSVLSMVEKGDLSAGHAKALLAISNPETQLTAAKQVIAGGLSVRKTEALAAKLSSESEPKNIIKTGTDEIDYSKEVSNDLSRIMRRRVKLSDGKNIGKIEIEFYGSDDRELLISQLKNFQWNKEV